MTHTFVLGLLPGIFRARFTLRVAGPPDAASVTGQAAICDRRSGHPHRPQTVSTPLATPPAIPGPAQPWQSPPTPGRSSVRARGRASGTAGRAGRPGERDGDPGQLDPAGAGERCRAGKERRGSAGRRAPGTAGSASAGPGRPQITAPGPP